MSLFCGRFSDLVYIYNVFQLLIEVLRLHRNCVQLQTMLRSIKKFKLFLFLLQPTF